MRRFLGMALLLGVAAACGGDGGTAPPTDVNLTGSWSVTMSPIKGYGITCQVVGLRATIVHTDNDLSGSYTMDDMVCNPGDEHSGQIDGLIVEGTAINGALHFHFDAEDFDLHGTVRSANEARGSYTIVLNLDQSYVFTGTWVARRQ